MTANSLEGFVSIFFKTFKYKYYGEYRKTGPTARSLSALTTGTPNRSINMIFCNLGMGFKVLYSAI